MEVDGLSWLLVLLFPLLVVQRRLQAEIQALFLLLTRRQDIAILLFSILFLPGVLLHELSHWIAARLMGVPTGRFSVIPQRMSSGRLRLGYVETASVDVFREAIIGAAPLFTGGLLIAYVGWFKLGISEIWAELPEISGAAFIESLAFIYRQPDFWLWFYLTFAVSSTMFPSSSDRRAWLPVGLVFTGLTILVVVSGMGEWLIEHLEPFLDVAIWSSVMVLSISLIVQAILWFPCYLSRKILNRITGLQVD
jgi:hypothetical protein